MNEKRKSQWIKPEFLARETLNILNTRSSRNSISIGEKKKSRTFYIKEGEKDYFNKNYLNCFCHFF